MMRVTHAALLLVRGLPAALKPIDAALQPFDNKAVAVYKTTPQGVLKMNLYFPPGWTSANRRPGIKRLRSGKPNAGLSAWTRWFGAAIVVLELAAAGFDYLEDRAILSALANLDHPNAMEISRAA